MSQEKSRQEEAYEYVTGDFVKLLQGDKRISYDHKRSVIAFWEDLFAHEGVRDNMIQAFSNFLFEIDDRMDAVRKAGIVQVRDAILQHVRANGTQVNDEGSSIVGKLDVDIMTVIGIINGLIAVEETPEEEPLETTDVENMDLGEVGGGDEDDTPLI